MKKHIIYGVYAAFLMGSASLYSCTSDGDGDTPPRIREERKEIVLTGETRAAADNLAGFYLRFTTDAARYLRSETSDNVVVSPLSASMVLAMLANGVDNQTRDEIVKYLGTDDIESLNRLSSTLLAELPKADKLADMALANSIWVNRDMNVSLTGDFASLAKEIYGAEIRNECFNTDNGKVINAINKWGSEHTNGLIPRYLNELSSDSYAMLLNALYFKAPWDGDLFKVENTKPGIFHGTKGDSEVEMMYTDFNNEICLYSFDDKFEEFSIPFGNSAYSMQIILPRGIMSVKEAINNLTDEESKNLSYNSARCFLKVRLPKFKTENRYSLDDMLSATGLSCLSSPTFSMFDNDIAGTVLFQQATLFNIDEDGAEIAAITSGDIGYGAPMPQGSYEVTIDRPFFFFIKEYSTGACILSGLIADI